MRRQSLPESVELASCRIGISTTPEASIDGDLGCFQADKLKILVQEGQPHDGEAITVLHELMHAVFFLSGAREDVRKCEEKLCNVISLHVYDLLRRNPKFAAYLCG